MSNLIELVSVSGRGVPIKGYSVNTDDIIPADPGLKNITWGELSELAFDYDRVKDGKKTDHPFNLSQYQGARILFANADFGSGSSREHAPQALKAWGIRALVAESYAGIFEKNCRSTGLPAMTASQEAIRELMDLTEQRPETEYTLDLNSQTIIAGEGLVNFAVSIPDAARKALVSGYWDALKMLAPNIEAVKVLLAKRHAPTDYEALERRV